MSRPRISIAIIFLVTLHGISAFAQETRRQFLSGHGKDDAVPWKFFCTDGSQSGYWTNLPVPSNWELHGFGTLSYQRDPSNAPAEQGKYEHRFTAPPDWSGQRVFLVFDGVMTDTRVSVNGESAGAIHQGSFYRFKYEITKLLKFGAENLLEVTVDKKSANAGVNRAERQGDYWLFGGIFRPVFLEAVPPQFIQRVAIDARANGAFAMDVFVDGVTNADSVEAQIFDINGKSVRAPFREKISGEKISLKTQIARPRQWTAETPNLYRVEVRLKRGRETIHRVQQRIGFRTMEVREGDGLYVNDHRVILKGANRHSFWPDSGRCLSEAVHRLDIGLMKDMNMNAVRMSHYPPDEQFLDLCDELGLYVLDELGGWQRSYDSEVGHKLVEEMVTRDANHPSILFWDNGNEGGWNTQLDADYGKWDPQQRRVLHPWDTFSGVNTTHYLNYDRTREAAEGRPMVRNTNHGNDPATNTATAISMTTEFLHGLYDGGIGAGFADYWELMDKSKFNGGAFFWALVDEGVKRPDTGKIDVAGNRAPDGILGPYREKEGSFFTVKEIWSPVLVEQSFRQGTFSGGLLVKNRYSFTDAKQCEFKWELRKFHLPNETSGGFSVIAKGNVKLPSIPPGEMKELKLDLPKNWKAADALALRVNDPAGRELWTWCWPLTESPDSNRPGTGNFRELIHRGASRKLTTNETADFVEINSGDLLVRISKQTGLLTGAQRGPQKFSLANGPRSTGGDPALLKLETKMDGADCVVVATFEGAPNSVSWRVRGNGWVQCDYNYLAAEGKKDFSGVVFDYPENLVKKKRWLGDGPYRVWKNRMRGVTLGVWENEYNNTITGWSEWKYPEFKGCFANVRWIQLETAEGPITAVLGRDDLFVQVLKPELPPENLLMRSAVSLPQAGLAFLHAIPPIGNKFQAAKDSGPQGQPNEMTGRVAGSVNFYFGSLPQP